jgi:sugar O-acyltransferase (sialic acid O-acetyltransferase NeuD family)
MRILIVGAGGHAQVVADIIFAMRLAGEDVEVAGYVDDDRQRHGQELLDRPVLGPITSLAEIDYDALVVAIGDNATRRRLFSQFQAVGRPLAVACHPRATIAAGVVIGDGAMICAGVVVNTGSEIGPNVILNTGCTVDHHNRIGAHTHIAPGVHLGGDVTIGEETLVGIGATVLPQTTIGSRVTVAAGSVVRRAVADGTIVAGVPARIIPARPQKSGNQN